jgi:hypothetical protein
VNVADKMATRSLFTVNSEERYCVSMVTAGMETRAKGPYSSPQCDRPGNHTATSCQILARFLFTCLFNDAVNNADYTASNDKSRK